MHAARAGGSLSLDEYLARGRFPINYSRYTADSGAKIVVDRVLHYENLAAELSEEAIVAAGVTARPLGVTEQQ